MSEEKAMRQLNNAIDSLYNKFDPNIFEKIKIRDASCPFHLEVFRKSEQKGEEVMKFRVALNQVSDEDIALCQKYIMPCKVFTKFIACRTGRGQWIIKELSQF